MKLTRLPICVIVAITTLFAHVHAVALELPLRRTTIPQTTSGVPHVQLGVAPVPEISNELLRRVKAHPNLEVRPTIVSLPGALGFWISEGVPLERSDVIVRGREFAHLHPDGSLHASLPPDLARSAIRKGWAIAHPWANQRPGWEGFVMIYTPKDDGELDVVYDLILAGYTFVTTGKAEKDNGPDAKVTDRPATRTLDSSQTCTTC